MYSIVFQIIKYSVQSIPFSNICPLIIRIGYEIDLQRNRQAI